jgi:hypothetical protein
MGFGPLDTNTDELAKLLSNVKTSNPNPLSPLGNQNANT